LNRRRSAGSRAPGKLSKAGFEDFEIAWRGDIYRDAPQQTAGFDFGIMGISYRSRKSL